LGRVLVTGGAHRRGHVRHRVVRGGGARAVVPVHYPCTTLFRSVVGERALVGGRGVGRGVVRRPEDGAVAVVVVVEPGRGVGRGRVGLGGGGHGGRRSLVDRAVVAQGGGGVHV